MCGYNLLAILIRVVKKRADNNNNVPSRFNLTFCDKKKKKIYNNNNPSTPPECVPPPPATPVVVVSNRQIYDGRESSYAIVIITHIGRRRMTSRRGRGGRTRLMPLYYMLLTIFGNMTSCRLRIYNTLMPLSRPLYPTRQNRMLLSLLQVV